MAISQITLIKNIVLLDKLSKYWNDVCLYFQHSDGILGTDLFDWYIWKKMTDDRILSEYYIGQ